MHLSSRYHWRKLHTLLVAATCFCLLLAGCNRDSNTSPRLSRKAQLEKALRGKTVEAKLRKSQTALQRAKEGLAYGRGSLNNKTDDHPDEALRHFVLKRAPSESDGPAPRYELDFGRYVAAARAADRLPVYSSARGKIISPGGGGTPIGTQVGVETWQPLGPGNIGGRTRALLIHPTVPQIMWTGGVAGGVWKTTNGGQSWLPKADLLVNIAINSLIMDPRDPDILYAGTGEGFFNGDGVRGLGIFKSIDGGETWNQLASTANSNFYYVNKLAITRGASQRIYAATRSGVWRSTDDGATWTQVHVGTNVPGGCLDLVIQTDRALAYVFATCGTIQGQARIVRAIDTSSNMSFETVHSVPNMGRTVLALAPSNQNFIYAISASNEADPQRNQGLLAVFRSVSNGNPGSWTTQVTNNDAKKVNRLLLSNPVFASFVECGFGTANQFLNQGWYDNIIAVDPRNPEIVWAGGIDLFRSDDGGQNFRLASAWWFDKVNNTEYAHADQHTIVFHPQYDGVSNLTMFVGGDGGVFRTNNARAPLADSNPIAQGTPVCGDFPPNSILWTALNNGYEVTQFYHGLPYPNGVTFFGGTQDNGTIRGILAGRDSWNEIRGGDGGYVAVDHNNTNIIYAENTGLSFQKSTNGGISWVTATSGLDLSDTYLFIQPFLMDPVNALRLWIGGTKVYRTDNGAANWTQASVPFRTPAFPTASGQLSAFAAAETDSNYVLTGTSGGWIHRTTTGNTDTAASVWPRVQPRTGYVSWVQFDPANKNVAYATYSTFNAAPPSTGHVWKSVDAGATWVNIDGSGGSTIPDVPAHSVLVDPGNPGRLYVGTDIGVFVSIDGGANWMRENTGFANVITEALAFNRTGTRRLYAFTHGRSAWRVDLVP